MHFSCSILHNTAIKIIIANKAERMHSNKISAKNTFELMHQQSKLVFFKGPINQTPKEPFTCCSAGLYLPL